MRLALLTAANPRAINSGHSCLIGKGIFKLVADGITKTKVTVRYENLDRSVGCNYNIGDTVNGPAVLTVEVIEAHNDDSRISVYAERID